jgi:predicted transcriptional regulator
MAKYILSDESLNSFGFRVKTNGINIESRYSKNPVILYNHNGSMMSVGKMTIEKINNQVIGTPDWDMEDELGKELARKYDKGYMNAFSISIDTIRLSEAPEDILPGQTRMTVVESELVEISATSIPSNKNAVRLSNNENNELPLINLNQRNMKKIALFFGLADSATEDEIIEKINHQKQQADRVAELEAQLSAQKTEIENVRNEKLESLLNNPKKKFTDQQKDAFRKLAKQDYDSTLNIINLQPDAISLSAELDKAKQTGSDDKYAGKSFTQLQKEAPKYLENLKQSNPDEFSRLFKLEFGKEPKL